MSCTLGVCVDILFACDSNSSDLAGRQQLPMVTLYTLFELVRFLESAGFSLTTMHVGVVPSFITTRLLYWGG
jgi:hypothetical protein